MSKRRVYRFIPAEKPGQSLSAIRWDKALSEVLKMVIETPVEDFLRGKLTSVRKHKEKTLR